MTQNETPAAGGRENAARLDALGFVEMTIYTNEDSDESLVWRNHEVMAMLVEIAERLRPWPAAED